MFQLWIPCSVFSISFVINERVADLIGILSFQIHVYNLETGKPVVCVGSSLGDFTCINLRDAPPHLLVCGNKDRR